MYFVNKLQKNIKNLQENQNESEITSNLKKKKIKIKQFEVIGRFETFKNS